MIAPLAESAAPANTAPLPESAWLCTDGVLTRHVVLPSLPAQTAALLVERYDASNTLVEAVSCEPADCLPLTFADAGLTDRILLTPLDESGIPCAESIAYRFDYICAPALMDYISLCSKVVNRYEGLVQQDGEPSYDSGRLIVRADGPLPDISAFEPALILDDGDGGFIIQFLSSAAAQRCTDFLLARQEIVYAEPDISISLPETEDSMDVSDGFSCDITLN